MFADVVVDNSCAPALLSRLMSTGQEREGVDVPGSDDADVSPVGRGDLREAEAFGHRYDQGCRRLARGAARCYPLISPSATPSTNADHSDRVNVRTGPSGS